MSTRASLFYKDNIHVYEELLDRTVHVEFQTQGAEVDIEIMTKEEWRKLMKGEWKPEDSCNHVWLASTHNGDTAVCSKCGLKVNRADPSR